MDFQDFYSGNAFDAYKYLGVHSTDSGYVFRVYAPAAKKISLIGDFSFWDEIPMSKIYDGQFWEVSVSAAKEGQLYKYRIYKDEKSYIDHADPYAFYSEKRPGTASIIYNVDHKFTDDKWLSTRTYNIDKPLNIYEVHAGSWKRKEQWDGESDPADGWLSYTELADKLIPYLKKHNYNALELMPLAEYPADESWGYQQTGFYSATSRYGEPKQLQDLIDKCHAVGIAVILDVVTVHFAVNDYALWSFDGTSLYEYPHPAVGYSEWGSCNFMHSRGDVRSFLQSSCAFWLDKYHFDGLRFDAVGNLIYWQGNSGRGINEDSVRFMQCMNKGLKSLYPDVMLIAEDSTPYSGTTQSVDDGGLGFDYKWDLGWMNDTLRYLGTDFADRDKEIGKILFSMEYFNSAKYLLPLSHDEVVHGKGTIVEKMNGSFDERIKQAKLLYLYMFTHPGKKLNFMGNELALTREWDERRQLDWESLDDKIHKEFADYCNELNRIYLENDSLWCKDYEQSGFRWISKGYDGKAVLIYEQIGTVKRSVVILNFTNREISLDASSIADLVLMLDTLGDEGTGCDDTGTITIKPFQGLLFEKDI